MPRFLSSDKPFMRKSCLVETERSISTFQEEAVYYGSDEFRNDGQKLNFKS